MGKPMSRSTTTFVSSLFIMTGGLGLKFFAVTEALRKIGGYIFTFSIVCLLVTSTFKFIRGFIKWMR